MYVHWITSKQCVNVDSLLAVSDELELYLHIGDPLIVLNLVDGHGGLSSEVEARLGSEHLEAHEGVGGTI